MLDGSESTQSQTGDQRVTKDLECKYTELLLWSWGHDIKGRTATIRDLVYLLRRRLANLSPDFNYIDSLLGRIDRISEEIGTNTPSPLELEQTSVNLLINERMEHWETIGLRESVKFQIDLDSHQLIVDVNPVWLGRVLDVVIENAVEATRESESKLIRITTQVDEKGVTLAVKDTGKGIAKGLLPELLRKPLALSEGRGRGLYMARLAVELYHGTIEVAATTPTGTSMKIWLPLSRGAARNV